MRRVATFVLILVLFTAPGLRSQVPRMMSYQGVLTDAGNQPVPDGNYVLTYKIYDVATGGTPLWTEVQQVAVLGGIVSVTLGSQVPITLPFDRPYWLGITINAATELQPRRRLTTAAYSFAAGTVDDGAVTPAKISTAGASAGQALVYDGTQVGWSDVGSAGGGFTLPVRDSMAGSSAAFYIRNTGAGDGVVGISDKNFGVFGQTNGTTDFVLGTVGFVTGPDIDSMSVGVFGENAGLGLNAFGVGGLGHGDGVGVMGESNLRNGVGVWGFSAQGLAGLFSGDVLVGGDTEVLGFLFKSGGGFKIDDPVDPANKYLYHSFVESPEMTNLYNGNVTLDGRGEAWVALPSWFEALNRDFRYQLTAVGAAAPNLHVAEKISGNRFRVAGGPPGLEVSWQVTGVRHDRFAEAHRIATRVDKPADERGTYLHPELYGRPETARVSRARPHGRGGPAARVLRSRVKMLAKRP